jgi:hypothetical protein
LLPFLKISALLQLHDDFFDVFFLLEDNFVGVKQLAGPFLCMMRQGAFLVGLNISVVVEDHHLVSSWLLFVLYDELFNVLAAFKEVFIAREPESIFGQLLPALFILK